MNPPEVRPPQRSGRRSPVLILGVALALLVVLGVGGLMVMARSDSPNWQNLEEVRDSFPIPDGFHASDQGREGGGCTLNPTCQTVKVFERLYPNGGQPSPTCAVILKAIDAWKETAEVSGSLDPASDCYFYGKVGAHHMAVSLVPPVHDGVGNAIDVVVFGS